MGRIRVKKLAAAVVSIVLAGTACSTAGSSPPPEAKPALKAGLNAGLKAGPVQRFLVFYADGQSSAALRAVTDAGGVLKGQDARLGYLLVSATDLGRISANPAIVGVTPDRKIGRALADTDGSLPVPLGDASVKRPRHIRAEPLAYRQWDMRMIGATPKGSYARATGRKVLVGVIDTGIDGKHPDIAPNFNRKLSRNFVTDRPKDPNGKTFDGKCEFKNCKDPADWDDDGHGTHVASTIGSPINGIGIAGVAPNVSLVNLRAGTDSGYFFLKPTLDALTYAADHGINVVNMSFYVDPWTYNCPANPADSPAEQAEQRAILVGMQRAVNYARSHGVTLISAIGNSSTDLGKVTKDSASPDYPLGSERARTIDNTCKDAPAELDGVISVTAVGPSGLKASYSDYGLEQADLSAPGGDSGDKASKLSSVRREILAAAPLHVLKAGGTLTSDTVVKDCHTGKCSYYQYLDGTSMASPHAVGVAAIIIGRFGKRLSNGRLYMDPAEVERLLNATSVQKSCPTPPAHAYSKTDVQLCEGSKAKNGFYGRGVVNAMRAATIKRPGVTP
ncbi:S8 family serine peptidase [Streptosporangiaceae bacterium NEAU-GS5]|nr:S8 family serine peptidase [Streptosporangiaceae bacterium NEAU-GS5]